MLAGTLHRVDHCWQDSSANGRLNQLANSGKTLNRQTQKLKILHSVCRASSDGGSAQADAADVGAARQAAADADVIFDATRQVMIGCVCSATRLNRF